MNTKDENTLSKSISAADDKANLDAACRSVLSDKYILAPILKDCTEEYKDCSIEDIATKYIEGTPQVGTAAVGIGETNRTIYGMSNEDKTLTKSSVTYDIHFRALVPGMENEKIELIINIEAQNEYYPGYPILKRAIYYCARLISAQAGTEFENSHYEKIKKVYSIWICMNAPKNMQNTITRYTRRHTRGNVANKN